MKVRCHCRAKLTFPDERAGKRGKCPKCGMEFIVRAPVVRVPPPPSAPPPPAPVVVRRPPPKALIVAVACLAALLIILIVFLAVVEAKRGKPSAGRDAPSGAATVRAHGPARTSLSGRRIVDGEAVSGQGLGG